MPLSDVKLIAKAQGATVNDVLVAAIAGALREYLARHDQSVDEVVWMVPVNLKGFEEDLPEELGNYFALVMLAMPLHHDSPAERLRELHHRMQRIKNSDEAVLTFGLQRTMSMTPGAVATFMTNFFANKAVGVLTNVPGPTGGMTLSDVPVRQVIGFAPCSGDQPMTATIFSFNGTVTIGFATDARLLPDPETLVDLVVAEAASMRRLLVPGGATRPRD
jgi:diacylglycerol O-acyltransferase